MATNPEGKPQKKDFLMPFLLTLLALVGAFNICIFSYIGCEIVPWLLTRNSTVAEAQASAQPVSTQMPATQPPATQSPSTPPSNLSGEWVQTNSNSEDSYHAAYISDNAIEIYWFTPSDGTTALYWAGSFTPPTTGDKPYEWVSQNNTAKTEYALLASEDASKSFTYEDGAITYLTSALGVTTTVKLEKQSWGYDRFTSGSGNASEPPVETSMPTEPPAADMATPEPANTPAPTSNQSGNGGTMASGTIVYVSTYSNTIHSISDCSGMRNYREMAQSEADSRGYEYCLNCW